MAAAPVTVLLHGWGGSFASSFDASQWTESFARAGRELVGIDLPGHGGGGSTDAADYAYLAEAVEKKLPPREIDFVGYSLGGKIALAIALRNHVQVRRLVIAGVGDNIFAPEAAGELVAEALVGGITPSTPAPVAALVEYSRRSGSDPAALAAVLRRPPNPVIGEDDLAALERPVLLVQGSNDAIATPSSRLLSSLPIASQVVLPDVDHLGLPSCPALLAAALRFLDDPGADPSVQSRSLDQ